MKQDSIQQLLAKRQAGTITGEELETLNRLTRRDEVVAAADRQAAGILRRRRIGLSALALTIVAVGGAGLLLLQPTHDTQPVAQQQQAKPEIVEAVPVEDIALPATTEPATEAVAVARHTPEQLPQKNTVKAAPVATTPVVVCNNSCEADSVINDIWKFLTA